MGMSMLATTPTSVLGGGRLLGPLLDRPPHDHDQRDQRDLERQHEPHESPRHSLDRTHSAPKIHAQSSRDVSAISVLASVAGYENGLEDRGERPTPGPDGAMPAHARQPPVH